MATDLLTPRQTVARLKADGLPVSEYALRSWVRTKQIPAAWIGKKAILFYPNVVKFICQQAGDKEDFSA